VYGKTQREVVEKLVPFLAQVQRGEAPPSGTRTVGAFLEEWMEGLELRVRPSTAKRYRDLLRIYAIPALGTIKLRRLTPQQVEALLTRMRGAGLAPRTVWHLRAVLRSALTDAVRAAEVMRNAAALAHPPKVEPFQVEPMTPARAGAILDSVAGTDLEAPVSLALWTGLRQGELLGLQWSDVDLVARRLSVAANLQRRSREYFLEPTKTAKSRRTISMPDPAVEVLTAHRQRQLQQRLLLGPAWDTQFGNLVFTDALGRPLDGRTLTVRFQTLVERAGLGSIRFHDLRHAAATLMLASGTDLKVVSEVLGHSAIATTANVYAGVLDELKTDAADRLARLVRPRA
jgi:integrase